MEWATFWSVLGGVGVPLGGLGIGWLTWKQSKKRDTRSGEHQLIDQYQERDREISAELSAIRVEQGHQRSVINTQADYISALRQHIVDGKPPPPPPYPEGMRV